jgi:hypothetical protein
MKIIGYTVGTSLPKPSLAQTDPSRGDYVKDKEALDDRYYTEEEIDSKLNEIADMYYTGAEIDERLDGKAEADHNHDDKYYTESEIDEKLDSKADISIVPTALSDLADDELHRTVTDAEKDSWDSKSQVQIIDSGDPEVLSTLNIYRMTQEEYDREVANGTIDENAIYLTPEQDVDLSIYATIEQLNNKADISHDHHDIYYTEAEVDSKLDSKADAGHNHVTSDISGLTATVTELNYMTGVTSSVQAQLDSKASADSLSNYYTKSEIDGMELITVDDIDAICGGMIQMAHAKGVVF